MFNFLELPKVASSLHLTFKLFRWWMNRAKWKLLYFIKGSPSVVVVSGGGAGTTTLISHLSKFVSVNLQHDGDGLKHMYRPARWSRLRSSRFIFVWGDADRQVQSLIRRDTLRLQAVKMRGLGGIFVGSRKLVAFMTQTLEDQKVFFETNEARNLLVIQFPDFLSDPSKIEEFLGLEHTNLARSFPKYEPRHSRVETH